MPAQICYSTNLCLKVRWSLCPVPWKRAPLKPSVAHVLRDACCQRASLISSTLGDAPGTQGAWPKEPPLQPSLRQRLPGLPPHVLCDDSVHLNLPFGSCCTVNHDSIWPSFGGECMVYILKPFLFSPLEIPCGINLFVSTNQMAVWDLPDDPEYPVLSFFCLVHSWSLLQGLVQMSALEGSLSLPGRADSQSPLAPWSEQGYTIVLLDDS